MKIILTLSEVKQIVATKLGLDPIDFELETGDTGTLLETVLAELRMARANVGSGNKVGAIVTFRKNCQNVGVTYGLWEAKTIVENLGEAIETTKRTKTWPLVGRTLDGSTHRFY